MSAATAIRHSNVRRPLTDDEKDTVRTMHADNCVRADMERATGRHHRVLERFAREEGFILRLGRSELAANQQKRNPAEPCTCGGEFCGRNPTKYRHHFGPDLRCACGVSIESFNRNPQMCAENAAEKVWRDNPR